MFGEHNDSRCRRGVEGLSKRRYNASLSGRSLFQIRFGDSPILQRLRTLQC